MGAPLLRANEANREQMGLPGRIDTHHALLNIYNVARGLFCVNPPLVLHFLLSGQPRIDTELSQSFHPSQKGYVSSSGGLTHWIDTLDFLILSPA